MILRIVAGVLSLFLSVACAHGQSRKTDAIEIDTIKIDAIKIDDYHWQGIERVVAIGDLHGDYAQYINVLRAAALVNSRGRWSAGKTHFVQTGDVPDRGPDTRKIIDHLAKLKKQAEKKGGKVHTLIGNHEAMNSYGDLRYVTSDEFQAFAGKNAAENRERQWEFQLNRIREIKPEEFLLMDLEQYRLQWESEIPLGWVEHRLNWSPTGKYGQWVLGNQVAVMVNDTIFLHGGLSPEYCKYSLAELTDQAKLQLQNYQQGVKGVLNAENGPLWYRGLALEDEDYFSPALDQILERYGASRIVVGHTPTGGVVWPRFNGRVVVNDTGIASHYGSNDGWLELSGGKAFAGYSDRKLELPVTAEGRIAYLEEVISFKPDNQSLRKRLAEMTGTEPDPGIDLSGEENSQTEETTAVPEPISPGICRADSF